MNDAENPNHVADNAIEYSLLSDHQLPKSRAHVVFGLSQLWVRLQRFKTGTQPDDYLVSLLIAPDFCGLESDFDDVALGVFGNFEFERTVGHPDPPGCLVA